MRDPPRERHTRCAFPAEKLVFDDPVDIEDRKSRDEGWKSPASGSGGQTEPARGEHGDACPK
eukprot:CAMPEP_0175892998 /NCGR_PEP_ID=MMETSP0107_2-20121207/49220_1 /TAXON_ID=195067 ORGANISM="Goniomonas pacifica, Strain CCMP1869" /NCGR_SAMPLE_ID=MMETSP0107_2 /ASSEMBLY_ACC=CAM_ASM_000203 /LENGTH=61 /DNA_ID=CAMNT_0017213987 /DNA_START=414 /DNA_END=596 /DNA_ORIENTATION=-